MKSQATHPKFNTWETKTIKIDRAVTMTEKAVKVSDELTKGTVWFPLSCVNVIDQFEIEVPVWLLRKKGLNILI